jgi:hypothetical protein
MKNVSLAVLVVGMLGATEASAQRENYSCSDSGQACARFYPQWASTKCAQAAAKCNKTPKGNGMCRFEAPDGKGSGLRRCD